MAPLNISGILVVVPRGKMQLSIEALNALPGVEVHHTDGKTGRIIVTQEADSVQAEIEGLKRIQALPHVVLAEMVQHVVDVERDGGAGKSISNDGGAAPPFLNE